MGDDLVFDDPLSERSADSADIGWGGDGGWGDRAGRGADDDLERFLREKPPHHT